MSYRWLTAFLDFPADSFDAGVAFWQAVTGSGLSAFRGANGEFATLLPPDGDAYLRVQRLAAGDGGCHLDLHLDTATAGGAAALACPPAMPRCAEGAAGLGRRPGLWWPGDTPQPGAGGGGTTVRSEEGGCR